MKINFTKDEYRKLIDLLEISDWVLHAHKIGKQEETKPYRDIIQKIYSYAKQMGVEHLIKYDSSLEGYFPTRKYEDSSEHREYIDEFENDSFWELLIIRLAERDLIGQYGKEKVRDMTFEERMEICSELEQWYSEEFHKNGLENLTIKIKSKRVHKNDH